MRSPNFHSGIARKLFWKHLFPHPEEKVRELEPSQPVVFPETRSLLLEILFSLVHDDPTQFMWLLEDMDRLVPVYPDSEGEISGLLPVMIREPC
jgi:ubiquitin carboxyl-terminal hydrolase 34